VLCGRDHFDAELSLPVMLRLGPDEETIRILGAASTQELEQMVLSCSECTVDSTQVSSMPEVSAVFSQLRAKFTDVLRDLDITTMVGPVRRRVFAPERSSEAGRTYRIPRIDGPPTYPAAQSMAPAPLP
jgi:hypothetical protein